MLPPWHPYTMMLHPKLSMSPTLKQSDIIQFV